MEHPSTPAIPTKSVKSDEYLKVFLALLISDGVLNIIQAILSWQAQGFSPTNAFSVITSILSMVVFIMAITVWVRSVKRTYPKFVLWTAISRVFVPILLGAIAMVISLSFVFSTLQDTSLIMNATNPEVIPAELANSLKWFSLLPLVSGLIFIGLGASTWIKIQKS